MFVCFTFKEERRSAMKAFPSENVFVLVPNGLDRTLVKHRSMSQPATVRRPRPGVPRHQQEAGAEAPG